MALYLIEIDFYAQLISRGLICGGGDLLEFGESECVGSPAALTERLQHVIGREKLATANDSIESAERAKSQYQRRYGSARAIYSMIFDPASYTSLDIWPAPRQIWMDLNKPFKLNRTFDYCINNGTSEHVFNQANVFRALHEHTKLGGLMIHWTPTLGWTNHGLYNVQPGFFFDLALANQYKVEYIEMATVGAALPLQSRDAFRQALTDQPKLADSLVCAALRKTAESPFVMPMQEQSAVEDRLLGKFAQTFAGQYVGGWKKDPLNLALGRQAMQSSTSEWSWNDNPGVDAQGGNNGIITGSYGFHTDLENQPWWSVDLTKPELLSKIVIYNRLDEPSCIGRAGPLYIAASLDNAHWTDLISFSEPASPFGGADGHPLHVDFQDPVLARYVKVGLLTTDYLHLDEIEIY